MRICALAVLALVLTGCTDAGTFACEDASDCAAAAAGGACEASGYCSFPDEQCASGRRYGMHAPADIAGVCVPDDIADDTSAIDPTVVDDGELEGVDDGDTTAITTATITSNAVDDSGSSSTTSPTITTLDGSDPTSSSNGGESSTTGTPPLEVEYEADIAVCTQATIFDPVACSVQAGMDQFTIDLSDTDGLVAKGWVRFVLDDALADAEVTSAEVVFVVGPDASDNSGSTSELWLAEPFDLMTLSVADPSALELIGEDLGPVGLGDTVTWSVPVDLLIAGEPLHLALLPVVTDGLDLFGASSDTPPRLVITAQ